MDILAHLERKGCLNLSSATTGKPEEQEGVVFQDLSICSGPGAADGGRGRRRRVFGDGCVLLRVLDFICRRSGICRGFEAGFRNDLIQIASKIRSKIGEERERLDI